MMRGLWEDQLMAVQEFNIEDMVAQVEAALAEPLTDQPASPDITMRERFFELTVMILANLYSKTPLPVSLLDRTSIQRVTAGMDDGDAAKLASKADDWLRLEGVIKQQEGQKAYYLNRGTLAVLSTLTSKGALGEIMDRLLKRYGEGLPSTKLREATRLVGSYLVMRLG